MKCCNYRLPLSALYNGRFAEWWSLRQSIILLPSSERLVGSKITCIDWRLVSNVFCPFCWFIKDLFSSISLVSACLSIFFSSPKFWYITYVHTNTRTGQRAAYFKYVCVYEIIWLKTTLQSSDKHIFCTKILYLTLHQFFFDFTQLVFGCFIRSLKFSTS